MSELQAEDNNSSPAKQTDKNQLLGKKRAHSNAFANGLKITAFFKTANSNPTQIENEPVQLCSLNPDLKSKPNGLQIISENAFGLKHRDRDAKLASNSISGMIEPRSLKCGTFQILTQIGQDNPDSAESSIGSSNLDKRQAKHQEKLGERLKAASKQLRTPKDSVCQVCSKDDDMLIVCSQCSGVFHFECAQPEDNKNISDRFICKSCLPKIEASQAILDQKKLKGEKTRKNKAQRQEAQSKKQITKDIKKAQAVDEQQSESTKLQNQSQESSKQEGTSPKTKQKKAVDTTVQQKLVFNQASDPELEEKARQVKIELKIFKNNYPEHMNGNSICYPIDDSLIQKLPLLHGANQLKQKPTPKNILVDGPQFEDLIAIWEFFSNFQEYVDMPPFKVEELYSALMVTDIDLKDTGVDEITIEESLTHGVSLMNEIFISLIQCFYQELPDPDKKDAIQEDDDIMLSTIKKDFADPSFVWPEILRMCLISSKFEEIRKLVFQDLEIVEMLEILRQIQPIDFQKTLSSSQKLKLLIFLVDSMHDLTSFRTFLNQRQEEKSQIHKQKNEIHAEIKQLENSKQDKIKELANSDTVYNSDDIVKKIQELEELAQVSSRTESKKYREQIDALNSTKNRILKEMTKIEDQVAKKQGKIEKLNELMQKSSLKNMALGKDGNHNEYWYFKEDPSRIYVKIYESQLSKFEHMQMINDDQMGENDNIDFPKQQSQKYSWGYYDEEEEVNNLMAGLNPKGVKEKALIESLKKILDKLKMKKAKRVSNANEEEKNEESKEPIHEDEQMMQIETGTNSQLKNLLEGENPVSTLESVIWFDKKKPKKRVETLVHTRRQKGNNNTAQEPLQEDTLSLECLKNKILTLEEFYTDTSTQFSREWNSKEFRDQWRQQVEQTNDYEVIGQQILQLDEGISLPIVIKIKESNLDNNDAMDVEDNGEKSIRRMRLMQFKYWPNLDLRESWKQYLFRDAQPSLQSLFVATKILENVNSSFIQRQIDQQTKKAEKERLAFGRQKGHQQRPSGYSEQKNNTFTGGGRRTKTANYYEGSDQSDNSDEEQKKTQKSKPQSLRRGPKIRDDDSFDNRVDSQKDEESDDDEIRQWQDRCYVCRKQGRVMCCESCDRVAHYGCAGLTTEPKEDWNCEDCLIKLTQRRTTRGQEVTANKVGVGSRRIGRRY